jgi:hypothetical protein
MNGLTFFGFNLSSIFSQQFPLVYFLLLSKTNVRTC